MFVPSTFSLRFSGYNAKKRLLAGLAKINFAVPSPGPSIVLAVVSGFDRGSRRPTPASAGFSPSVPSFDRSFCLPSLASTGVFAVRLRLRPSPVSPGFCPWPSDPALTGAPADHAATDGDKHRRRLSPYAPHRPGLPPSVSGFGRCLLCANFSRNLTSTLPGHYTVFELRRRAIRVCPGRC